MKKPPPSSEKPIDELSLPKLRVLLRERGDAKPSYLFKAVEASADMRDYRYVFWLDLMGARNLMKLSLPRAARSIMKIHAAALSVREQNPKLEINPVMDGVYGFVKDRELLEKCLTEILSSLANVFIQEHSPSNRFMIRAGVAFGPIIPGSALSAGSPILQNNLEYLGGTAIGMGISHAYEAEGSAPPFGVYIHESARAFAPLTKGSFPYRATLWRWFDDDEALTRAMQLALNEHFAWLEKNPVSSQYDVEAMRRHKNLAVEYFELHTLKS
ncbi:MAG TPA: hypothetical protein VG796_03940 [Verrucomicrobiales bacterium]|nr:hypothetical protein [Verrucomicrobiales bacterium]